MGATDAGPAADGNPAATAIIVAYNTPRLDLSWIPRGAPVLVVHNDGALDRKSCGDRAVEHVVSGGNVGFGAAVNRALATVRTGRVVLVNPDVAASPLHWPALADGTADEIRAVPLREPDGTPTSIVNRYPTRVSALASGLRLGRFVPRGGRARRLLAPLLGSAGTAHTRLLADPTGRWPLRSHWVSAALVSVDTARLRSVGGFDPAYFLYWEDVDLCRRLAERHGAMSVVVPAVPPAVHAVGGSAKGARRGVEAVRRQAARRYCRTQGYRVCELLLSVRAPRTAGR